MNFREFKKGIKVPPNEIVFVGLGNESRSDDAAGLLFTRELKKHVEYLHSNFVFAGTNPENYLEKILEFHPKLVIFIDAARWSDTAGKISWIEKKDLDSAKISTHAFSITMVEEYLKAHESLQVKFLGIQPESTTLGHPVSDTVKNSIKKFFRE